MTGLVISTIVQITNQFQLMEQTNQQITQKPSLPIKTKIAAWITIISGIIGIINIIIYYKFLNILGLTWSFSSIDGIYLFSIRQANPIFTIFLWILMLIYFIGTFFIAPVFLLRRKKWAWWFVIIGLFLSLISIFNLFYPYISGRDLFYPIALFFLLLLDRKNFFKIAT